MRINEPVTNKQVDYDVSQKIVSTTNIKGVIEDINDHFVNISGFTREELIGQAHNLVRHPSMPQAAFKELWEHNKAKKPWMGMVKNRCKNGDHYWVDAFVSPVYDGDTAIGYQSVRQKPSQEYIDRAEKLYKMNANPLAKLGVIWQKCSLNVKLFASFSLVSLLSIGLILVNAPLMVALGVGIAGNYFIATLIAKPWQKFAKECKSTIDSSLAIKVYTGRYDELGQAQLTLKFLQSQLDTVLYRSADVSSQVKNKAQAANQESQNTSSEIDNLYEVVKKAIVAKEQMAKSVENMASNSSATSDAADESKQNVNKGQQLLNKTRSAMDDLVLAVDKSSEIIENLSKNSSEIGSVVDVISGIAEQTNLLALNAAIEAARAGEQGRGFAVVADEVRALAAKTQESTQQISDMISNLQSGSQSAVSSIKTSHEKVNTSAENINVLEEQFSTILDNVNDINDRCVETANSAKEQIEADEVISTSINNIKSIGENTIEATRKASEYSEALEDIAQDMNTMIKQFSEKR